MKKTLLLVPLLLLTSCTQDKTNLYDKHLKNLVESNYVVDANLPFEVTGRYKEKEDGQFQMELIYDRAQFNMHDITFLMVDSRQVDLTKSLLNFGYFKTTNYTFIDASTDLSDKAQRAYRFSWLSDINNPILKCVMSYQNNKQFKELYFEFSEFDQYESK